MFFVLFPYIYFLSYEIIQDDILLNFEPSDKVMFAGRIGMGLTMLVAITMMTLPCRDIMFTVFASIASSIKVRTKQKHQSFLLSDSRVSPHGVPGGG